MLQRLTLFQNRDGIFLTISAHQIAKGWKVEVRWNQFHHLT